MITVCEVPACWYVCKLAFVHCSIVSAAVLVCMYVCVCLFLLQSRMHLARALKSAGRLAGSADMYRAVLKLQPDHPAAHYKLGSVLRQLGQQEAAAEAYRCVCV